MTFLEVKDKPGSNALSIIISSFLLIFEAVFSDFQLIPSMIRKDFYVMIELDQIFVKLILIMIIAGDKNSSEELGSDWENR